MNSQLKIQKLLLLAGVFLLAVLAPFKVGFIPASALTACADTPAAIKQEAVMPCCASHATQTRQDRLTIAVPDSKGCCCEAAPVVPGNMETTGQPSNSSSAKFIPIKSSTNWGTTFAFILPKLAVEPDEITASDDPHTTKLPLYLQKRSLLI